jgi:hypothetical protein
MQTRRTRLLALALMGLSVGGGAPRAEAPQVLSWIRADVDGDGAADAVTLRGDGKLLVEWQGAPASTLSLGEDLLLKRPADVQFQVTASGRVILARATELRRGGAMQPRALAVVAAGRRLTVAYAGPVGPVGRDGEYTQDVAISPAGLLRYQTAPSVRRCDGEQRLFVERYREGAGFQPDASVTLPPQEGALSTQPQILGTAPADLTGPSLGIYRWVSASAQAHVTRADLLGPPRELEDDSPLSAWAPAQPRGAFITAQADGGGHSLRALRLVAARGKPLPSRIALIIGGSAGAGRIELALSQEPAQWVVFPDAAAVKADCVSLLIREGAADAAIGDAVIYSEADGQDGLTNLAAQVLSGEGSRGEGSARTLLLRARRDAAGRQAVLDAVARALQKGSGSPEGQRRLDDLLLGLADGEASGTGSAAGSAVLDAILWQAVQRRLQPAASGEGQAADFLRTLSTYKRVGPRLLLRIAEDRGFAGDARGTALSLWAALAPAEAPARLLALLDDAARDAKLGTGWSAALSTALRCRATDDPAAAGLASALAERLRGASEGRSPAALPATALLLQGASQALANCPQLAARSQLAERIAQAWPTAAATGSSDRFLFQYRLLQALDRLAAPAPAVLALLPQIAAQETDPALRQLASALRVRLVPSGGDRLVGLLDADVGVRLATLAALTSSRESAKPASAAATSPQELAQIDQVLLGDGWPKVRRAAAEARAAQCRDAASGPTPRVESLRQALADRDADVQRRALVGLARCEGSAAVDVLIRIAGSEEAKASLRGQACALLARHGMAAPSLSPAQREGAHRAAGTALIDLLRDPQADDRHAAALSQCLRGFADAGDLADLPVLIEAAGAESPATVRQLAFAAIGSVCGRPTPPPAAGPGAGSGRSASIPAKIQKSLAEAVAAVLAKDPDLRLQASARRAQELCR